MQQSHGVCSRPGLAFCIQNLLIHKGGSEICSIWRSVLISFIQYCQFKTCHLPSYGTLITDLLDLLLPFKAGICLHTFANHYQPVMTHLPDLPARLIFQRPTPVCFVFFWHETICASDGRPCNSPSVLSEAAWGSCREPRSIQSVYTHTLNCTYSDQL